MNYPNFKVCVKSFTFNQAAYITDTMNGFVMQQTTYPFVCCIVDDASTDGEQEVIRKYFNENFNLEDKDTYYEQQTDYATILYAQHKTNHNCYFAILFLKENHYSQHKDKLQYLSTWRDNCEYEALCEGDDYWIHPQKLQMQTDVLEHNPNVWLVHTAFCPVNANKEPLTVLKHQRYIEYSKSGDVFAHLLWRNYILTLTVCYRREMTDSALYIEAPSRLDYQLF